MAGRQDDRLERITNAELRLPNRWDIPTRIFANPDIPLEAVAIDELESVLRIQETVSSLQSVQPDFFDAADPRVLEVVLTPDFHKGAGIPIGTVLATRGFAVPQAIGNDVNCGMRLMATALTYDQVRPRLDELDRALRHTFFEGGRNIPMTPVQRDALVRQGLPGLIDTAGEASKQGLWAGIDADEEWANLDRMHGQGGYATDGVYALGDYIKGTGGLSHDSMIGGLGGGNHFAEIQYVRKILHGQAAYAWGLKEGQIVVMIHAGSLRLGHVTGNYVLDAMRRIYPAAASHPDNSIYPLPVGERFAVEFGKFLTSLRNAANFAFGNRFFLAQMVRRGLEVAVGPTVCRVIYDAPHNLMWEEELDGATAFVHRKGATPAGGWQQMQQTAYGHWGEPVIVPGSMGAASYLLLGKGNRQALCSACHGAGRQMSRGEALKVDDEQLDAFLRDFRVVTALDPNRPDVKQRRDIVEKWRQELKKEAPYAYKEITPVIATLQEADIAQPVVELYPLMTVKG